MMGDTQRRKHGRGYPGILFWDTILGSTSGHPVIELRQDLGY